MNTYIALFRGINVGGNNILPMKPLADLLKRLGCEDVRTYIQIGNVVFNIDDHLKANLAKSLSDAVLEAHGFAPKVLLLTASEFSTAITNNRFSTEDGKLLHFFFLSEIPQSPDLEKLETLKLPSEVYELKNNIFYLYAPEGVSRSKLFAKVEKCLGVPATARNWNTVNKLAFMIST
jgi:uncharacterized protein (DUF1697 family)